MATRRRLYVDEAYVDPKRSKYCSTLAFTYENNTLTIFPSLVQNKLCKLYIDSKYIKKGDCIIKGNGAIVEVHSTSPITFKRISCQYWVEEHNIYEKD